MNITSPKSSFCKLGLYSRQKPLKVMVLGQGGVGKSAMVVRFITRRYIGEYDPSLEKVYAFHTVMDNEMVYFDILDTAGQPHENECLTLEANIRWAEAFILMYSVTDKCSFDECNRLKFLINYNKRRRRLVSSNSNKEGLYDIPVVLVGNKNDQWGDRMVTLEDGQRRSKEIGCVCFHEISVRESIEQVWSVFRDVCRFWRVHSRCHKLKRSTSDVHTEPLISPELLNYFGSNRTSLTSVASENGKSIVLLGHSWNEVDIDEAQEDGGSEDTLSTPSESEVTPFRGRASTDGHLLSRPRRWRYPPPVSQAAHCRADRRMSISMRGNNASC
ncbi:ras-related and estrogen-regulated growth inhibitor [Ctenocephalides felis]|uniref:ras-related and estrogen-regulated growth inhibitor n=1 Tax=Ctenocephalides felis TaxID=7515 RepID=UPI000E6E4439|nr:ras-related and estrogen-regulated growth inhibitor [Ctenocephalides felis]